MPAAFAVCFNMQTSADSIILRASSFCHTALPEPPLVCSQAAGMDFDFVNVATGSPIAEAYATYTPELYDGYMKFKNFSVKGKFQQQDFPEIINAEIRIKLTKRSKYNTLEEYVERLGSIPVRYESSIWPNSMSEPQST